MAALQPGRPLTPAEEKRIVHYLKNSTMTWLEIAEQCRRCRNSIALVARRHGIRRHKWKEREL